ncbi:unnamed protein product [Notodromas monacha]|uniref:Calpain catalytic domain-containing protein n=1 Tax=Notodromas monacha TaxID=399045 RepID=A0A7R9GI23_9CRUS|nr:unnamed protein product [Notodromas monacha]CAG0923409.1 unnamed protein product [Notodromas monacha]
MDAMVDLTGGIAYIIPLAIVDDSNQLTFFKTMYLAFVNGCFLTCDRLVSDDSDEKGLVNKHAYTITNVAFVEAGSDKPYELLCIRNPFANSMEWNGAWSDTDEDNWSKVSEEEKARIGFTPNKEDGKFWMSFENFRTEFTYVQICTVSPDFDDNMHPQGATNPQNLEDPNTKLTDEDIQTRASEMQKTEMIPLRENLDRFSLTPGNYVIIPCSTKGEENQFLLRVYSAKRLLIKELIDPEEPK